MRLGDIAQRLQGRLDGDPAQADIDIIRVAGIDRAQSGDLTFVSNPKYISHLEGTQASAVIVSPKVTVPTTVRAAILRCDNPYLAFAQAVGLFVQTARPAVGVDRHAAVAPDAVIGEGVSVGAFVTVGAVRCYVPLAAMGDPAPTRARDALTQGETRTFIGTAKASNSSAEYAIIIARPPST